MDAAGAPTPAHSDTASVRSEDAKAQNPILATVVVAALVIGEFSLVRAVVNSPEMVWTHPTLSSAEQEQAKAECRMEAVALFGAGSLGDRGASREQYISDCLIAEGFVQTIVEEEDSLRERQLRLRLLY